MVFELELRFELRKCIVFVFSQSCDLRVGVMEMYFAYDKIVIFELELERCGIDIVILNLKLIHLAY